MARRQRKAWMASKDQDWNAEVIARLIEAHNLDVELFNEAERDRSKALRFSAFSTLLDLRGRPKRLSIRGGGFRFELWIRAGWRAFTPGLRGPWQRIPLCSDNVRKIRVYPDRSYRSAAA